MDGYAYAWEYVVAPGREEEFLRLYGSDGAWVRLFRKAAGYRRTDLLRDRAVPRRFLTIDRWESREAWEAFRVGFASEFDTIDRSGNELTLEERELGTFTIVSNEGAEGGSER
jgi:heme-degrading monooxygenase HmoA